mmetsp:Transcript_23081/g.58852  ORF Transcript_23081/g.58852 Transcript_23081/m.58852 type:complete len:258 (-) Transcript_23081:798-1571(-)
MTAIRLVPAPPPTSSCLHAAACCSKRLAPLVAAGMNRTGYGHATFPLGSPGSVDIRSWCRCARGRTHRERPCVSTVMDCAHLMHEALAAACQCRMCAATAILLANGELTASVLRGYPRRCARSGSSARRSHPHPTLFLEISSSSGLSACLEPRGAHGLHGLDSRLRRLLSSRASSSFVSSSRNGSTGRSWIILGAPCASIHTPVAGSFDFLVGGEARSVSTKLEARLSPVWTAAALGVVTLMVSACGEGGGGRGVSQ